MDTKYITVEELLGELKDHPMLEDLTLERVITYAIQFCKKLPFFSQAAVLFYIPTSSASLPAFGVVTIFHCRHSDGCTVTSPL